MESVVLLRRIQRIRHYYRGLGPDAHGLFDPPESDRQFDAAIATFGLRPRPLQLLFSGASTVAAVNAILGSVGIALLCVHVDLAVGAAVAIGIAVAAVLFGFHVLYQERRFAPLNSGSGHLTVTAEEGGTAHSTGSGERQAAGVRACPSSTDLGHPPMTTRGRAPRMFRRGSTIVRCLSRGPDWRIR